MTKERTKAEKEASDKLAKAIAELLGGIEKFAEGLASKTPFKNRIL